ncbi:SIMPL domain-containing protein [Candidatus Peregrinibacteria bacterium]|nr:SIMPL domain-containing protein [Candidatus Peregrinibacteria bacterium]
MSYMDDHRIFLRPPLWLPIFVALVVGGAYIGGKVVETRDREKTLISVSGEGRIFSSPDIAELSFGVQTGRVQTAKVAMDKLRKDMDAIFQSVKGLQVEEKDIRTEHFSLNPVYDWTEQGQIFRGFEASQSFRVKVRDLDQVDEVLTAALDAGANQAGNVQFTIDDPEGLRAQARAQAIKEAEAKANVLAESLGKRLGKLKGFSEGGGYGGPVPMMMMRAEGMGKGGGMPDLPFPTGEEEINVQVTLTYELR